MGRRIAATAAGGQRLWRAPRASWRWKGGSERAGSTAVPWTRSGIGPSPHLCFNTIAMSERHPLAFLSYVRSDDAHDGGKITTFRERLEGEVKMHTGKPFPIFQDRNDLAWGQHWESRIRKSLNDVTFLISIITPIITPSFFESPACRDEFNAFVLKERTLGIDRLILPVYYLTADQMSEDYIAGTDPIADIIRARQWTDWRLFRFKSYHEEVVAAALASLAATIKDYVRELEAIIDMANTKMAPKPPAGAGASTSPRRSRSGESAKAAAGIDLAVLSPSVRAITSGPVIPSVPTLDS
jgi:hypothetical protein